MTEIDRPRGDFPWRCGTCRHWRARADNPMYGECERWLSGYHYFGDRGRDYNFSADEVVVENDEGWGSVMGHNFGCSLWEKGK